MKEIIKNVYEYVDNKFYFKLLYLFITLTYVTILKYIPGTNIVKNIVFAWGILLLLLLIIEDYKRRKIYKFDIPLGIFMILTLIFNLFVYRDMDNIKVWMVNLIVFTIIFTVDVFRNKKELIKEMNIISCFYVVFMLLASGASLIMYLFNMKLTIKNVVFELNGVNGGVFENKNALSIAAALAIVLCIYLNYVTQSHRLKLFWLANIVLQVAVMMVGSHGRSADLIVIAVVYTFVFVYNKNKYVRTVLVLIPILACIGVWQVNKENIRLYTSGRSNLWESAAVVVEQHPLAGVGYNDMIGEVKAARPISDLPGLDVGRLHNIYVETATVNGTISLLLFISFLGIILAFIVEQLDKLQRKEKIQMTTLTSLIVGIIAVNLFESNLINSANFISMIFWIYLGYLVSILDNKNVE
ncbi:O-antigen ligase family protein [Clostridium sp. YIM B02555]|uniref:O-antigen ligase family protein n=1 Tax=Clostridium sp. YIM B02555 TaxID=2911968 RepID=UPI001EED6A09|nr:O-antigen ligase family protein [Clostridium sp. YIM B02555]